MDMSRYHVYRNLRTKTFSLKYKGRVIGHPQELLLQDAEFHVLESGRRRVIKERRKNVHAVIKAQWIHRPHLIRILEKEEVYYNPYKTATFTIKATGEPVHEASMVMAKDNQIFIIKEFEWIT